MTPLQKIITKREAEKFIDSGVEVLPTSWVDVDKNSGLTESTRVGGKTVTTPGTSTMMNNF